jgi:ribosomal protein L11 methyltransferase
MDYLEVTIDLVPRNPWAEIAMVQLADQGFESFVDTETGLLAYAQVTAIDVLQPLKGTFLEENTSDVSISTHQKIIPQQNWNATWEADFQPVVVENYLTILAPFHERVDQTGMLVEILPKMSFGTGHHQTTWMMAKALFELKEMPKKVLDMGTGTGVLAIIAEKLGAQEIVAVDIEDWSVENTIENAERNACNTITALCGDIDLLEGQHFELILANINKNVLKAHIPHYSKLLVENGTLFLSGFFDSDVEELVAYCQQFGLNKRRVLNKDNWAAIELYR